MATLNKDKRINPGNDSQANSNSNRAAMLSATSSDTVHDASVPNSSNPPRSNHSSMSYPNFPNNKHNRNMSFGSLLSNLNAENKDELSLLPQLNESRANSIIAFNNSDLNFIALNNQNQNQNQNNANQVWSSSSSPIQYSGAPYSRKSSVTEQLPNGHERLPSFFTSLNGPVFNTEVFLNQNNGGALEPLHSRNPSLNNIFNYTNPDSEPSPVTGYTPRPSVIGFGTNPSGPPGSKRNLPSIAIPEFSSAFDNFVKRDSVIGGLNGEFQFVAPTSRGVKFDDISENPAIGRRMSTKDITSAKRGFPEDEQVSPMKSKRQREPEEEKVMKDQKFLKQGHSYQQYLPSNNYNAKFMKTQPQIPTTELKFQSPTKLEQTPPAAHSAPLSKNLITPTSDRLYTSAPGTNGHYQEEFADYSQSRRTSLHASPVNLGNKIHDVVPYPELNGNQVQSKSDKPFLGSTKVDQLMLVIQARAKGVKKQIPQALDGSLLDDGEVMPNRNELVGGIDKLKSRSKASKKFPCQYCNKNFTQSTHLDVHVRSHIGIKPYKCDHCGKSFTQGGNLRTHLRSHTGERPFQCDECEKSFSRKGNLAQHKLTHSKIKPFKCKLDDCDKSFTQLGNLKAHQNRFHLSTVVELTTKFAELGDDLSHLPALERETIEYFMEIYKNSNKGIKGRGKQRKSNNEQFQTPSVALGSSLDGKDLIYDQMGNNYRFNDNA